MSVLSLKIVIGYTVVFLYNIYSSLVRKSEFVMDYSDVHDLFEKKLYHVL